MFAVNSRTKVVVRVWLIMVILFNSLPASATFAQAKQEPISVSKANIQDKGRGKLSPTTELPEDGVKSSVLNQQSVAAESKTPITFIENVGQFDPQARFQTQAEGSTVYLSDDAIWFTLVEPPAKDPKEDHHNAIADELIEENQKPRKGVNLKVNLIGSNPHPTLEPFQRVATSFSYFTGSDPANWQSDVPV